MPVKTTWILPGKLIHLQMFDFVSREDVYGLTKQIEALIQENSVPPVHLLVDYTTASYIPTNLGFLSQVARSIKSLTTLGYVLILGNRFPLMAMITQLVCQMTGINFHSVTSLDEAVDYLQTVDPGPDDARPENAGPDND